MTDREKMLTILNEYNVNSIKDILHCFLEIYGKDISVKDMYSLFSEVNYYLEIKINKLERLKSITNERVRYIKRYLEGKMWSTEEAAKKNVQPQINNAQEVIDACNDV